jgi:hypothetical protein
MSIEKKIDCIKEKYVIYKDGRVWSKKSYQYLKPQTNIKGYYHYSLCGETITMHRLLAYLYVDGYKKGLVVNHIDGNKKNNNIDNLEWISNRDNSRHWIDSLDGETKQGTIRMFNKDEVKEVKRLYSLWKDNKDRRYTSPRLAKMYNVSKVTIMNIINGKRYHNE